LRVVALVWGRRTTLRAVLDASAVRASGATFVGGGAARDDTLAIERARQAGTPVFVVRLKDFADREAWDAALADAVAEHAPDLVVLAGFMKLVGPGFMGKFGGRIVNTHPALSPAFPGMHGPRDALAYGVKITGCTLFVVDEGIDTGPIIAQASVPVLESDDEESLHERIKSVERRLLVDTIGKMAREGWTVTGRKVTIP
jgi:phosphoribosylglycinamide formyltransferase-1